MPVKIQIRRGLAAAWTAANPILAEGEVGYELDTGREKIGNGINNWNALPYFSPGGAGSINISAGTTSNNLTNAVFSNSNGVSFGLNGSTITATVATNYQAPGAYLTTAMASNRGTDFVQATAAFAGTNASGTINSTGISVSVAAAPAASSWTVSDNATSGTVGRLAFTNLNGVTLSLSTGAAGLHTIVGSHNALTSQSNQAFSAGGGSSAFQTLSFGNSFGVSFTNSGGSVMGSVATSLTNINVSAGTTSNNLSALTFSNLNSVSFGLNGSVITASINPPTGGNPNFSAGTTSSALNSVVFSNSNGVSFGLNGSTITATVQTNYLTTAMQSNAATISNINVSAGTTSTNASAFTFSNSNGVSFGLGTGASAGVVTATVQTNYLTTAMASNRATDFVAATAAFAGTNASGTINSTGISVSVAAPAGSSWTVSDNATSATVGRLAFTQSNGITMSLSTSNNGNHTLFASYTVPTVTNSSMTVSDNATSGTLARLAFTNLNGVTLSLSTGAAGSHTIVGSVFTNYQSTGNYLTTAALSSQTLQFTLGGNVATTNSSQILNGGFILAGGNNLTIQQSNNSVSFSVGAYITTADLSQNSSKYAGINGAITGGSITVNTSGVSVNLPAYLTTAALSQNSSLYAGTGFTTGTTTGAWTATHNTSGLSMVMPYRTRLIYPDGNLTALTAPANASQSFRYFPLSIGLTGTRIDALISMSAGSAATTATAALAFSVYAAIYTRNGATLSSLSSGSTQTTYSYASNSAGQTQLTQAAIRPMSVPVNFNMPPGEYFVGFNLLTNTSSIGASTTNLGLTMSIMGGNAIQTAANYNEITAATATSVNLYSGMGVYSAASTGLLSGVSLSGINQTGSALSAANIALVFRNA